MASQQYSTSDVYQERLHNYLDAQIEEVYRYKWCMGIQMHRDPLDEFTINDIFVMWIQDNARNFRAMWITEHGSGYFDGTNY